MKHVKKPYPIIIFIVLAALLLAACGGTPTPPAGRWPTPSEQPVQPAQAGQTPAAQAPAPAGSAGTPQPAQPAQAGQTPAAQAPAGSVGTPQPGQPVQPAAMPGQDLGGQLWQWAKTTTNDGKTVNPSNPANYTIEFSMIDGRVNIKADCNNATGDFMTDGQSLQIMIGGVTLAMCSPDSLSQEFLKELSEVGSYQVQGTTLTLTTGNGAMTLTAGQPAGQPAAQPPSQPAAQPPSQPAAAASLEGPTWKWTNTAYSNGSTVAAPDPAKYTLRFDQATKRFIFTADCNNGSGSYTVSGQNLTMHVEGMTRAYCPPPSDDYIRMLDQVASYKIDGNTLSLALGMNAGIMTFTTGDTQPAPGAGSSGATTPTKPASGNLQRLTSGVWKWQQSADNSGQTWTSPNPANYTLQFNPDGTVAAQVDCNRSSGTYQADESNLTITLGPTTMMACPPPTLDNVFRQQLSQVSSYFFDGDSLVLLWKMDSGSMKFAQ